MRHLLLLLPLALGACAASPEMVPMAPPVVRSVERVLDRHDAYVQADQALDADALSAALWESEEARSAVTSVEAMPGTMLGGLLEGPMARHDAYVSSDLELDPLIRSVYLESTARLRSLIASVPVPAY